jgi:hypothetical protein
MHGHKAKLLHAKRYSEKVAMKRRIKAHEERDVKSKDASALPDGALPTYLLDREGQNQAKALSSAVKEKRKEKAGRYSVPLPKVRGIAEEEMFKVIKTGKHRSKGWKRMVTKVREDGKLGCSPLSLTPCTRLPLSESRSLGNPPSSSVSFGHRPCATRAPTSLIVRLS